VKPGNLSAVYVQLLFLVIILTGKTNKLARILYKDEYKFIYSKHGSISKLAIIIELMI